MSSRADRKAQAREQRLAREHAAHRSAQRRRSVRRLGVLVVAAALLVGGAIVAFGPGSTPPPDPVEQRAEVAALFDGLPQDGRTLGAASAPATLTEFADLQCPFCAEYARNVLPAVVDRYVRTGKLRLDLQLLAFLGEDSVRGGRMAAAAARQNRLWPFVDAFYRNQGLENTGYADDAFLQRTATAAGIDVTAALRDREAPHASSWLESAQREADRLRVQGTPAFSLRIGDGRAVRLQPAELTPESFASALDAALAAH
jgi:protein-disulfide isomerase